MEGGYVRSLYQQHALPSQTEEFSRSLQETEDEHACHRAGECQRREYGRVVCEVERGVVCVNSLDEGVDRADDAYGYSNAHRELTFHQHLDKALLYRFDSHR